jgi:hypothetical protein
MPINIQVFSHAYEDEKCLGIMEAIERGLKK